ncbi:MAG: branched-chain amino acid transport system permease protein [Actinomycetota bacterium]|jgi:ABC-type branched-subunit amino acid transport system permease subunit|nr:branched-chain amino acid transport system permease protein [Actinomycetota bacterium]MDQ1541323.1 branched-chain amino acid transport system permease protein [Actinomycetota bacterium]
MMVGPQEGSQTDYSYAFRKSVLAPRIVVFLAIGVLLFFAITYWPRIVPYLTRPGFWPLVSGSLAVVAAITLMHWYDPVGNGKFTSTATLVSHTSGISALASAFFAWLAWTELVVVIVAGGAAIILGLRWLAFAVAAVAVAAAIISYLSHQAVDSAGGVRADHSLGYAAAILGYLVIASAMCASATTQAEQAQSKEFVGRVLGFRPGLPLVSLGVVLTLLAFLHARWFSPGNKNTSLSETHSLFAGSGLTSIAFQYLGWLGWVLFVVGVAVSGAAVWTRSRLMAWVAVAVGVAGAVLTLVTLYEISKLGAAAKVDGATGPWQNLGAGGWMACAGLFLLGAAGFVVATASPSGGHQAAAAASSDVIGAPANAASRKALGYLSAPGAARSALLIAVAAALFYPPTATPFWQEVVVSEIGISMLLAVGLNVVVGWAGLLDLGFIAFYAIGSYTTAYLVGSLPVKPPHWLIMAPLLTIPFAIVVCLLAGLALGAPTLRLRGDYLAIVTLGFGEIIHLSAVNSQGITNGSEGLTNDTARHTKSVPNPSIHLGPLHVDWGLNQLQYWYLLLVFLVLIILAFRRLEESRLGRAWAAVREDEVAAQATGINTIKVKLAAFAIGASTSGVAGAFFASQIGVFTPDNFVLNNSILIVAYVVFGGMGSLSGAVAGAAMLTWLPEFLKYQVPPADKLMWIGAVVLLMMIFRPAGLIPARRRAAELHGLDAPATSETFAVPASEGL